MSAARPRFQVPGRPCATGKKNSFQLAGLVLIRPVLNMKLANTMVALGVVEYTTFGALIMLTISSTEYFSLVASR